MAKSFLDQIAARQPVKNIRPTDGRQAPQANAPQSSENQTKFEAYLKFLGGEDTQMTTTEQIPRLFTLLQTVPTTDNMTKLYTLAESHNNVLEFIKNDTSFQTYIVSLGSDAVRAKETFLRQVAVHTFLSELLKQPIISDDNITTLFNMLKEVKEERKKTFLPF